MTSRASAGVSAIRSVLLHLDATPASAARLALANSLAERHGARLTALFGVRPDLDRTAFAYSAGAALRAAEGAEGTPRQLEWARLRDLFAGSRSGNLWCEVVGDTVTHAFLAEAIYADLLILGQPVDAGTAGGAPPGFVESVILESGVPAIVLPPAHRLETIGSCVLLAWNGSAQAAGAMRAALPIMQRAEQVHVVSWAALPPAAPCSRLDVATWLERHGIASKVHLRPPSSGVADELASLAGQLGADLVVMGCYGHNRLRERVFGGVTRSTLARLPVPVLMAH
ncbi:MAG: universal stress protein [Caldimonas sp.]